MLRSNQKLLTVLLFWPQKRNYFLKWILNVFHTCQREARTSLPHPTPPAGLHHRASWSEHRAWDPRHAFSGFCSNIFLHEARPRNDLAKLRAQGKWGLLWFLLFLWKDQLILGSPMGTGLLALCPWSIHLVPQLLLLFPQGQDDTSVDSHLNHPRKSRGRKWEVRIHVPSLAECIVLVIIITGSHFRIFRVKKKKRQLSSRLCIH